MACLTTHDAQATARSRRGNGADRQAQRCRPHNPGVHGAILTEALASRFDVHIEVTTDWDLARHLGVPAAAVIAGIGAGMVTPTFAGFGASKKPRAVQ